MSHLPVTTASTGTATGNVTTAAAAGGSPVVGLLSDPAYIRWLKATRALNLTVDVLRKFCDIEMKKLHQVLVGLCGGTPCTGTCSCSDTMCKGGKWAIKCPTGVCSKWLTEITAMRTKTSTRLTMNNADIRQWPLQHWQVAKVYMGSGQARSSVKSSDTDVSGLIQLVNNCKHFANIVDVTKVDAVRIKRNALMHSTTMKLTVAELSDVMKTMTNLLLDHHQQHGDPAAQQTAADIQQIEHTIVDINDKVFLENERKAWKQVLASQSSDITSNKTYIHQLISSNAALKTRLHNVDQSIGSLKSNVENLQENDQRNSQHISHLQDQQQQSTERIIKLETSRQNVTGQTVQFRIKGHAAAGSSKDHSEDIKNIQASIMKKMLKIQLMTSSEMSRELISIEIERMICLHSRLIEYDREIKDVTGGSVIVSIMCPTLEALDDLHQLFMSGKLARMFTNAYVADEYRQSVTLNVTIDETEWQRCRAHLLSTDETRLAQELKLIKEELESSKEKQAEQIQHAREELKQSREELGSLKKINDELNEQVRLLENEAKKSQGETRLAQEELRLTKEELQSSKEKHAARIRHDRDELRQYNAERASCSKMYGKDMRCLQGASKQDQPEEKSHEKSVHTAKLMETLRAAARSAESVEGESEEDQKRRTLDVIHLLREHDKPELWRHVARQLDVRNHLDLSGVLTKNNMVDVEYVLASGVASNVTILSLDDWSRSTNDVLADDETVHRLCRGLEGMKQLETLDLDWTGLTDAGLTRVCQTVTKHCRQLTYLECDWNPGVTDGVEDVVGRTLRDLSGLTIDLIGCRLSTYVGRRLEAEFPGRIHVF